MASIQKRRQTDGGNISYRVRFRDPTGKSRSKTFTRLAEARAYAATVETSKLRGEYVGAAGGRTKFSQIADDLMEARRLSVRPSTFARDQSYMRSLILPDWADCPVGAITPTMVQAWVTKLSKSRAPSTVRKAHQLVANVLDAAVTQDLIARSPDRDTKLPKMKRAEMLFLTPNELGRLADTIDPRYRCLVLVGGFAGLRLGEALGLTVGADSLDLLRRRITVSKQLAEVRGDITVTEPKTHAARRVVALPIFLVDALAVHLEGSGPGDLVFQAAEGGPVRRTNFRRRYWEPAITAAGCAGLRFHDLRHSHVAMLIGQGEHPSTIASRLGHASVATILDVYGHLLPGTDEAAADRLDDLAKSL